MNEAHAVESDATGKAGTYDLIVSLGGNCSAAAQLNMRGLRQEALPFDWVYVVDERPFIWLAEHVGDRWRDLCLKENLQEITPGHAEWSAEHADRVQYVDRESGYRFVNHFNVSAKCDEEYLRVYGTLRRRVDRLVSILQGGRRVLFLVATGVPISDETLVRVVEAFGGEFPGTKFTLRYLHFGAESSSESDIGPVHRTDIARRQNGYDFVKTNYEWAFLDEVRVMPRGDSRDRRMETSCRRERIRDIVFSAVRRCAKAILPYGVVRAVQKRRYR